ncbi:MAG TPA: heparin lyase I family protein [Thermoleophilaceae bacterium]|nr:heparin lyase I family protein [Thermoleophilaceae bacterium]
MSKSLALLACLLSALAPLAAGCAGERPEMRGDWAARSTAASDVTFESVRLSATVDPKAVAGARIWWELSSDGGASWKRATRIREHASRPSPGGRVEIAEQLRPGCPAGSQRCSPYPLRAGQTYHYRVCADVRARGMARDVCFGARGDRLAGRWRSFTTSPGPSFAADFSSSDTSEFAQAQCRPGRLSVAGGRARFEVREGDLEPQTGYEGRCELLPGPVVPDGEDVWQRFSVSFSRGFSTTNYAQFAQWHASGGDGQAALAFRVAGASQRLQVAHGGGTTRYWTGPVLETGRRYDFVAHIKFDDDPERGYVELWLDGERQQMHGGGARAYGPTSDPCISAGCPDSDPSGSVYPKLGIYRSRTDTNSVTLFADDFRLGREAGNIGFSP